MSFWYHKTVKYSLHMIPLVSVHFRQESRSQASQVYSSCHAVWCCKGYFIHLYISHRESLFLATSTKHSILQFHMHIFTYIYIYIYIYTSQLRGDRKFLGDISIRTYSWNLLEILSSFSKANILPLQVTLKVCHFISGHDLAMTQMNYGRVSTSVLGVNHFEPMIFHIWPPNTKLTTATLEGTQVPHRPLHKPLPASHALWGMIHLSGLKMLTSPGNIPALQLCEALPIPGHSFGGNVAGSYNCKLHSLKLTSKSHWTYLNCNWNCMIQQTAAWWLTIRYDVDPRNYL